MGYKIGIDFGTTNSMVAYVEGGELKTFVPDPEQGVVYIPSCMAYRNNGEKYTGKEVEDYVGEPDVTLYKGFKMYLPMEDNERRNAGWPPGNKSPEDVITDYLSSILTSQDKESGNFSIQKGRIDGIVLSIPHVWSRDVAHAGRERLLDIITRRLGQTLIQLISEPVAAAAFYAYDYHKSQGKYFEGNLLVCDMGGGTFDITLCKVTAQKVEELYNDGNGWHGLGQAGVIFDTRLIINGFRNQGKTVGEESADFYKAYFELQGFKSRQHKTITEKIIAAIDDEDRRNSEIIRLKNSKLGFNYLNILEAFKPVEEGINQVFQRFKKSIDEKGYLVDAIYVVGGFSQFILVREAIKRFWGIGKGDVRYTEEQDREKARFAICYGAALVANEMWSVEEKYTHTIGIVAKLHRQIPGREDMEVQDVYCPIIVGGKKVSEYEAPKFIMDATGQNYQQVTVYEDRVPVTIYIEPDSRGKKYQQSLPEDIEIPNRNIPGNKWIIGMQIDKSKIVHLIIKDVIQNKTEKHLLGDVIRKMFSGIHIISD